VVVQIIEEDGFAKEGVLTIGDEVEWNNNLDEYNARVKQEREFVEACEILITELFEDGCPCEHSRFRDYIKSEGYIRKIDQEFLWGVFAEKLKTTYNINYNCPSCRTNYNVDYKEVNAFFGVLQV